MRENLTYGLTRVQGKQALIYVLRPCPTLQSKFLIFNNEIIQQKKHQYKIYHMGKHNAYPYFSY